MLSALSFVPRGHAKEFPTKYKLTEEEFERIQGLSALQLSSARGDLAQAKLDAGDAPGGAADADAEAVPVSDTAVDNELAEYNLEDYDKDGPGDEDEDEQMTIFKNIRGLAYHADGEDDPYVTIPADEDSDEDEREDLQILPTDDIVLAARTEDDVSHLEVYIYEDESSNLYVHHDILLPSFPLCLEWVPHEGNLVAVGTFEPDIELWDLDTIDSIYPRHILGCAPDKKRRKKANDAYHVDAVLDLSSNPNATNLLVSASADRTLKLWDLSTGQCAKSYRRHEDKVSAVEWHPKEATVVASGGYDRRVVVSDARIPDKPAHVFKASGDVENVSWRGEALYASTEDGVLYNFDLRSTKPVWRIQAHDGPLSSFSVSPSVPGLIATGGQDRQVKIWSTTAQPTLVTSRDFDVGKVFALGFLPDAGANLVCGGSSGILRVWDLQSSAPCRKAFDLRSTRTEERVVQLDTAVDDDDDGDDDDGDEDEDAAMDDDVV